EIKAGGEAFEGQLRWTVGGWFMMEEMDLNLEQDVGYSTRAYVRIWSQDTYGFAGYGEFAWDFLDDFTLEGGIRYNWEKKSMDYSKQTATGSGPAETSVREDVWQSPTGTIQLKYRFSDLAAVYWKYTHGYKSGYFNANEVDEPAVKPESINAIETGFRGSWFEGMVSMSADVFYYRYNDYQVFLFSDEAGAPPILKIVNAPKAEVYGSEIQVTLLPLQELLPEEWSGLRIQTEMGWLSSRFLEFQDSVRRAVQGQFYLKTIDYAGNALPNSPDFTLALTAEWEVDLGSWGSLVPRYDLQWTDDVFFDQSEGRGSLNDSGESTKYPLTVGQASYALHNLQLLYRLPSGMAEVRIWGRNISDTRYKDYAFDASVFRWVVINFVGQPRTVGFDLKFNF
ncbi:MAG: TonB-dependent receptor, partial [Myxococcota bacterium]